MKVRACATVNPNPLSIVISRVVPERMPCATTTKES